MSSNEKQMEPDSSPLPEPPKRKRGRPKKQPQQLLGPLPLKKPRGRPKGSKKLSASSGQTVESSAEKRPRGRPRKWPQLRIQEKDTQEGHPQESRDLNSNSPPATGGAEICSTGDRKAAVSRNEVWKALLEKILIGRAGLQALGDL